MRTQRQRRSQGFSMTEMMVAVAIMGVLVLAVATFVKNTTESVSWSTAAGARDTIVQTLTRTASRFQNIQDSAANGGGAGNAALLACLDPGAPVCTATSAAAAVPFNLGILRNAVFTTLAGTTAVPQIYGAGGERTCAGGVPYCPFWEATAWFYATCPNETANCLQATSVHIGYRLSPAAGITEFLGHAVTDVTPTMVTHRVIGKMVEDQQCPPATEQTGIDADGKILCSCRFGFAQVGLDANGFPICNAAPLTCGNNQMLQGRDNRGHPICCNTNIVCTNPWFNFNDEHATCPSGGWLTDLNLGQCTAGPAAKKASSRGIECDTNRGRCCRMRILLGPANCVTL